MSRGDCIYSLDSVSEEEYSKIFDSYLTKKCKNQILDMLKSPDPTKHYGNVFFCSTFFRFFIFDSRVCERVNDNMSSLG
jgi:hypothetical protein